jgi:hypothetical protein
MPSSSGVDTRTFKQRKSFGNESFFFIRKNQFYLFRLFKATRKEEVAGIRSKFPNSKLFSLRTFIA